MSWGPPARIESDGADGEILIYTKRVYIPPSNDGSFDLVSQYGNYWIYTMFWVNSEHTIYHWKRFQQDVAPTQLDIRIFHRNQPTLHTPY
jgi:hypothetical protein